MNFESGADGGEATSCAPKSLTLADFDYDLPPELIAQTPSVQRDSSRLLVMDRYTGQMVDSQFSQLPLFLRDGDVLVANRSRVIPARIFGRLQTGAAVELLLVRRVDSAAENLPRSATKEEKVIADIGIEAPVSADAQTWEVMSRPARKLPAGTVVNLPGNATAVVLALGYDGRRVVRFHVPDDFNVWLHACGLLPVPPYIKSYPDDPERYQTVYAEEEGSIATPTAGLHFTPELLRQLIDKGVDVQWITLHVGPGTFKPVVSHDLDHVRLEPERASVSESTAQVITAAKSDGRRIIAVGTTTTRTLEGLFDRAGKVTAWSGEVELFIRPPFQFKVIDALITNFHLPRSTLLMLVSAFAGTEHVRRAYAHAVEENFRFYSFGDAMFIAGNAIVGPDGA